MASRPATSFQPAPRLTRGNYTPWDTPETRVGTKRHPNLLAQVAYADKAREARAWGFSDADVHDYAYAEAVRVTREVTR